MEKLEGDHQAYQYLLEAIRRDGVPYELISKIIPIVEDEVNDILNRIVEFNIIFYLFCCSTNNESFSDDIIDIFS